jgi:hypothetical protein
MDIYNTVGYIGAALYLLSYALLNINKVSGNSYLYIGMNLVAALFVILSCIKYWNGPSVMIQSCWVVFSVIGLLGVYKQRKRVLEDR